MPSRVGQTNDRALEGTPANTVPSGESERPVGSPSAEGCGPNQVSDSTLSGERNESDGSGATSQDELDASSGRTGQPQLGENPEPSPDPTDMASTTASLTLTTSAKVETRSNLTPAQTGYQKALRNSIQDTNQMVNKPVPKAPPTDVSAHQRGQLDWDISRRSLSDAM